MEDKYIINLLELRVLLELGVAGWNQKRLQHPDRTPVLGGANLGGADLAGVNFSRAILRKTNFNKADLSEADLSEADLSEADFSEADLSEADLSKANLYMANLTGTTLSGADLSRANLGTTDLSTAELSGVNFNGTDLSDTDFGDTALTQANLSGTDLSGRNLSGRNLSGANLSSANLSRTDLSKTDLSNADLNRADLSRATLVETNLTGATLTQCTIYGISVWNVQLEGAKQDSLVITSHREPTITVDDLEVAQFIYLLLNHKKLRNVLNAVTKQGVLLLGRFGGGGLEVLQAIATKLRAMSYLPMIFDFERPHDHDYTETVKTLVGMVRFVIVDLSGPSVPQELSHTVPFFDIPFVPIIEKGRKSYAMFVDLFKYPWVLKPLIEFADVEDLLARIPSEVIAPAEKRHQVRQQLLDELFHSE